MCPTASPPFSFASGRPFAVGRVRCEVAVQHIGNNSQTMVAVGRNLMFTRANRLNPFDTHQPTNTALTNIKAHFLELHRHPRPTAAWGGDSAGGTIQSRAQDSTHIVREYAPVSSYHRAAGCSPFRFWCPRQPFAKAAGSHLHDTAYRLNPPNMPPRFNKREPHDFWLAKNCPFSLGPFLISPTPPEAHEPRP
jgi:hypothetical protein